MLENLTFEAKSLKTPVFIAEMQKMQKMQIENGKTTFGAKENMCIFSVLQDLVIGIFEKVGEMFGGVVIFSYLCPDE